MLYKIWIQVATLLYENKVANLLHFLNITMATRCFKTTESIMNNDFFYSSKGKYKFSFMKNDLLINCDFAIYQIFFCFFLSVVSPKVMFCFVLFCFFHSIRDFFFFVSKVRCLFYVLWNRRWIINCTSVVFMTPSLLLSKCF